MNIMVQYWSASDYIYKDPVIGIPGADAHSQSGLGSGKPS
jgi:hypothetical protein